MYNAKNEKLVEGTRHMRHLRPARMQSFAQLFQLQLLDGSKKVQTMEFGDKHFQTFVNARDRNFYS